MVYTTLAEGVKLLLGKGDVITPEQSLAQAVARESGLPTAALGMPPELLEKAFRLVDRTDEVTVRRLLDAAQAAGFHGTAICLDEPRPPRDWRRWALGAAIIAMVVLGAMASVFHWITFPPVWLFLLFLFPAFNRKDRPPVSTTRGVERIPIAYRRDLRLYLDPKYSELADALVEAPKAIDEAPDMPPDDPIAAMHARTVARLDALTAAITAETSGLSDVITRDLHSTVDALRDRADALKHDAVEIKTALDRRDDAAETQAAARVEARLERLRTLQGAGDRVDAAEIAGLEKAIAAHRDAQGDVESREAQLTRILGGLLEVGAAAARAQRQLSHEVAAGSVADLLAQLRFEAEAASRAMSELDTAPLKRSPGTAGRPRERNSAPEGRHRNS